MNEQEDSFHKIMLLGFEISQMQDLDILLERVLSDARELVNADAGSIYIKEGNRLIFTSVQNDTLSHRIGERKVPFVVFSIPVSNASIAGYVAGNKRLLNIPDAYHIPSEMPYHFDKSWDKQSGYRTQSMLTIPLIDTRNNCIGVLQLINAQDSEGRSIPFTPEAEMFIQPFAMYAALGIERAQLTRTIIMRMISMAELRDPHETAPHVNRVSAYAVEIYEAWARNMGIASEETAKQRETLRMAAMLHDVGKVGITDAILKKTTQMTDAEYDVMKSHTILGARLFTESSSDFDEAAAVVALNHHERWDGNGYPGFVNVQTGQPLSGYADSNGKARSKQKEEIPIYGRVVALADVYDALSSNRVYRKAWSEEKVLQVLTVESGNHFDPDVVNAFLDVLDVIRSIAQHYPEEQAVPPTGSYVENI